MTENISESVDWNFTAETNSEGRTYIKAYKMQWDKAAKKPKRALRRHVGRLMDDGLVKISPKFLQDHPQYAGKEWYWGSDNNLVPLEEYGNDIPDFDEHSYDDCGQDLLATLNVGLSWAAWQIACRHGIHQHLQETFGTENADALLHLAIYRLAGNTAMESYDLWRRQVWLPENLPLSDTKISEILESVTRDNLTEYFEKRHARVLELQKNGPQECGPDGYVFDSRLISDSSNNSPEQYGQPYLRMLNRTMVCDRKTGDILFVQVHDAPAKNNEADTLADALACAKSSGFDLSKLILITDRESDCLDEVQDAVAPEVRFVQGVMDKDSAINREFTKHGSNLEDGAFYNGRLKASAFTCSDPCNSASPAGSVSLHLYRLDGRYEEQKELIRKGADEIIRLKYANRHVPLGLWDTFGRYVRQNEDYSGKTVYSIEPTLMDRDAAKATRFVLRSNCMHDPFDALETYRMRDDSTSDLQTLASWLDDGRLAVGTRSMPGKVFVHALAASLRMLMLFTARQKLKEHPDWRIPGDSIDHMLGMLNLVRADKRNTANAWVRCEIPERFRQCFDLLGLDEPPKVLKVKNS